MTSPLDELIHAVDTMDASVQWTSAALRPLVREFLEINAEDRERFPEAAGGPVWTLWGKEERSGSRCAFLVGLFEEERVTFIGGRGESPAVQEFGGNYPHQDQSAIAEAAARFDAAGAPVILSREAFDLWLSGS